MPTDFFDYTDARRLARRRLPWMVFDYIDGAAGTEQGEALNRQTLQNLRLQPRVLNNVEHRDIGVQVFGKRADLPFGTSPMGMCNLAGPNADMMLARLAAKTGAPLGVSTVSSTSLENLIMAANGNAWFQLYFSGDGSGTIALVNRAQTAGYETLVLTLDVPEVGRRPRELRRGFKMPFKIGPSQFLDLAMHPRWSLTTLAHGAPKMANFGGLHGAFDRTETRARADWAYLASLRDQWKGKLVVKGVLDTTDAKHLVSAGVDAIQVSSHGGRQLDSAPPPILALGQIRKAVGPDFPLFFDSGLRSGEDIVKAYAMGANFVFLGRPMLFAIAADNAHGLDRLCDILKTEISLTLAQLGHNSMSQVSSASIWKEI
ncbi:MAG: alpha-hydroxy acid oxidase [Proteobacteria bacterium]|nr:alpha-hydroxy acid oxidase [Pseudomonadota bacterium]